MSIVIFEDSSKEKEMLQKLQFCTCLPRIKGFEPKRNKLKIVFSDAKVHDPHMDEQEFIDLVKGVYNCALNGVYLGPVSKKSVLLEKNKTVILPNFNARPWIVSGRIVNPRSFFTTIQTLADTFKNSGGIISKISHEKMPAILGLMDELDLKVQSTPLFLPSLGIWRHFKVVEEIKGLAGQAYLPIRRAKAFLPFLSKAGKIFSSMEDVTREVLKGEKWRIIFSEAKSLSDIDPTAIAFLMTLNDRDLYIFNSGESVEMHTMVGALAKFNPYSKILEIHDPIFKPGPGKKIEPPKISSEEIDWLLRTIFGAPCVFESDKRSLINCTGGELFAISDLISRGKWWVKDGIWHVESGKCEKPNAAKILIRAHKLAENGEKPNLGIELVDLAQKIKGKDLESFESLRAFFHKVLGDYDEMKNDLEKASKFGNRTFRNAYFSVVLSMNGMEYSLLANKASKLVEVTRTYAKLVSKNASVSTVYKEVITPLEKLKDRIARRIEAMARNYIGIKLVNSGENEEALNEFETALSIAKEYDFRDLSPLIGSNIWYAVFPKPSYSLHNRILRALRESVVEGLWKAAGLAQLLLASDLIEMGEFQRAKLFLRNSKKACPQLEPQIDAQFVRMKVENMEFEGIDRVKDSEERNRLKPMAALYKDDEKQALEILKSLKTPESEELLSMASGDLDFDKVESSNYLATYFVAKEVSNRPMKTLKRMGRYFYMNAINIGKVFYEEQLSKAYQRMGFLKVATYHMRLAISAAKQFGLKRRAEWLSRKIKEADLIDNSYELTGPALLFQTFKRSEEILKSLGVTVSKRLNRDVICELNGVEKIRIRAKTNGIAFITDENVDLDFAWAFGQKHFVYSFPIDGGVIHLSFDTTDLSMDDALLLLDQIIPIYALHIEKSIAAKNSNFDSLTGLYSRRYILERLDEEVERSKRYGEILSVAMIDVDDFKKINDEYGHDVGDEVLRHVSKGMSESVRSIDMIGRYGGEEFLIIFPHTPAYRAVDSCERVRRSVEAIRLISSKLTISIGLADSLECDSNAKSLIKCADIALYIAKERGKNQVTEYSKLEVKK